VGENTPDADGFGNSDLTQQLFSNDYMSRRSGFFLDKNDLNGLTLMVTYLPVSILKLLLQSAL
jgi:hypothetical protein